MLIFMFEDKEIYTNLREQPHLGADVLLLWTELCPSINHMFKP